LANDAGIERVQLRVEILAVNRSLYVCCNFIQDVEFIKGSLKGEPQ
jgi:hypothetical protein